ncbi:TetR/AcrR family transcriptional regulator [Streptomyces hypolithicus]
MVSAADRARNPARSSVWFESQTSRTRKADQPAGLDRGRITAVSVRLLDAEGLAKFSMRRLAAELNVTAMSLYWYVDTKDDLLELALDSVFSEITPPDESGDWRERLRSLSTTYRELLVRHVWVSPLIGTYLNIGPHSRAFSLAVHHVMRATGLPPHGQMGGMSAVFQFVYGFGTVEGHFVQRCASAGMSQDDYLAQAMGTMRDAPELSETFDSAQEMLEARAGDTVAQMRERDFDFALETLIAGIEAMAARTGSP